MRLGHLLRRLGLKKPDVLDAVLSRPATPLPYRVVIETLSYCNGTCAFCPANKREDIRPKEVMPTAILERILAELAQVGYCGIVSLHGNSEPLLNPAIVDIVGRVRDVLPDAVISLWTNGTLLSWAKHEALFARGLNQLWVNNYTLKGNWHRSVREFTDAFAQSAYAQRPDIVYSPHMRLADQVLYNKAGFAPNKAADGGFKTLAQPCTSPLFEMQFNFRGDAFSCSWDDYYNLVLGNIMETPLPEIWDGPAYRDFRGKVLNGNRAAFPTCAKCDSPGARPTELLVRTTKTGHPMFVSRGVFGETALEQHYTRGAVPLSGSA